jgi:hypothetical protein
MVHDHKNRSPAHANYSPRATNTYELAQSFMVAAKPALTGAALPELERQGRMNDQETSGIA